MPIRFRCEQCGQKLRVNDDKVGLQTNCPKCKAAVTVPAQSHIDSVNEPPPLEGESTTPKPVEPGAAAPNVELPATPVIRTDAVDGPTLPEIVIRDDSFDWVHNSKPNTESLIDYDKVAVPRRVLYLQGGLLGVVALVSFVLGMLMSGGTARRESVSQVPQTCILSGEVTYGNDQPNPDGGSVVVVLPVDRRPAVEARVGAEGLRPGDPLPADGNIGLRRIHSLGGAMVRANDDGMYQIRLPEKGRYHVLVISRRATRSGSEPLEVTDVAQIGRYFSDVVELLADRKYKWETVTLRGNTTLDATF